MKNKCCKIGLVMKSLQADFFKVMQKGAEEYVAESKECELLSVGTNTQTEVDLQVSLVERLIDEGVDAIVVVPIDSKALVAPVVKAVRAGIKVVNIDIRLDEDMLRAESVSVDFVGPDNFAASYEAGCRLASSLSSGDLVVMVEGLSVADNARQRKAGFDRAIAESGLECVASLPADWETAKAESVFRDMYLAHPDIKAVFCCNDAMALGVIDVLKEAGCKGGDIKVAGFDNDEVMRPLIDEGWLFVTVDAYGSQMAVEGIRHAMTLLGEDRCSLGDKSTPFTVVQ